MAKTYKKRKQKRGGSAALMRLERIRNTAIFEDLKKRCAGEDWSDRCREDERRQYLGFLCEDNTMTKKEKEEYFMYFELERSKKTKNKVKKKKSLTEEEMQEIMSNVSNDDSCTGRTGLTRVKSRRRKRKRRRTSKR